jgi:hypothetical protein
LAVQGTSPNDLELQQDKSGTDYFGRVSPNYRQKAILTVANDMYAIISRFQANCKVAGMDEFKLLTRVFNEQCNVQSIDESKVIVKEPQDVNATVSIKISDSDDDNASSEPEPELNIQDNGARMF